MGDKEPILCYKNGEWEKIERQNLDKNMEDMTMGRHTKEWIDNEDKFLKNQLGAFSFKDENYKHPTIKVHFGEEYVPVPQIPMLMAAITSGGCFTIKEGLRLSVINEAMKMVGIVGNVYSNNDLEKIDEAISKIIYEKGPYYVYEKAFSMGFNSDIAIYFSDKEPDEPFFVETNELTYDDVEF